MGALDLSTGRGPRGLSSAPSFAARVHFARSPEAKLSPAPASSVHDYGEISADDADEAVLAYGARVVVVAAPAPGIAGGDVARLGQAQQVHLRRSAFGAGIAEV